MIFTIQCDSPVLWQNYLSDPVSITSHVTSEISKGDVYVTLLLGVTIFLAGGIIVRLRRNQNTNEQEVSRTQEEIPNSDNGPQEVMEPSSTLQYE